MSQSKLRMSSHFKNPRLSFTPKKKMSFSNGAVDLIEMVNKLQDKLTSTGNSLEISLPQIVVVGSQSAGKSSTLENIVGREFLPRGTGVVTRRPTVVQLLPCKEEYATFLHKPEVKFTNFQDVKNEISEETNRNPGPVGFSSVPISLKIYSPEVLKLTLVDLPGLIRVTVDNQSEDSIKEIRNMVLEYISQPNCLILAVSPANQDIANSDALEIAKTVDPKRIRTIGVLTKLDLMDEGTDARDVLENKKIPLTRGYVGILNRSQKDIEDGRDIAYCLDKEEKFFATMLCYKDIADRMGTLYLRKTLNEQLYNHIKEYLPTVRKQLCQKLASVLKELKEIYDNVDFDANDPSSIQDYMIKLTQNFIENLQIELFGCSTLVSMDELSGGTMINYKLYKSIQNLKLPEIPAKEKLFKVIANSAGARNCFTMSSLSLETVLSQLLNTYIEPLNLLVDDVADVLDSTVEKLSDVLGDYSNFKSELVFLVRNSILDAAINTKMTLENHLQSEMYFVNTGHKDFNFPDVESKETLFPIKFWRNGNFKNSSNCASANGTDSGVSDCASNSEKDSDHTDAMVGEMTARFQISWLDDPAFKDWLEEVPSDINRAKCKLCHTSFSLSNMGRRAVRSHASGKEHKKRQTAGSQTLPIKDQVCTRYYTSAFFGRSTADEIRQNFRSCLSNLYVKKLIQISMDGPNVNLKFYRDIKEDLRSEDSVELLNVGTCGLHVLHGAFKRGIEATNWSLISFFRSLYYLFKDVPSRRALYTEYTGSSTFPQKFCSVRWLNNENVAERALEMLPHLKKFVDSAKKDEKEPTCSSYKIVSRAVEDELFGAKLAFFKSLTSQVEPFLKEFQTDVPLVPFLYTSLSSLLRDILSKFIKEDILNKVPVNKINIEKSLLPPSQIDIGYGTRSAIKKNRPKISDQDILNFRRSCIACFKALSEKLLEKSPLTFPLCKAVTCFDPNIAVNDKLAPKRISNLLTILEDSKLITSSTAEKAEREYMKICSEKSDEIKQYRRKTSRVDVFWRNIFRSSENCDNILSIMKIIMILYHGNANVERGFSINSECLVENLHEETLVAQRIVYDSMKTKVGDLRDFEISKSLIQCFKNARSALTEATKRKEKEILERESEMQKKKKAKMAAKELSNKILEIKENANKEVSALMEEMKTINAQLQ